MSPKPATKGRRAARLRLHERPRPQVLERRHEFGVCSALGLRPVQLGVMIFGESLALTAISLSLGLALGLGLHHYLATTGLDLRWFFHNSLPTALVTTPTALLATTL